MTDPCWLPSAIMQTTAALLGLYVVVYVLTIERFLQPINKDDSLYHVTILGLNFIGILAMSISTIILNTLWLDSISTKISYFDFSGIGTWAISFFFTTILFIFGYTLTMVLIIRKNVGKR